MPPHGDVAEWLRSGLQNRLPRFNSGRRLHKINGLAGALGVGKFFLGGKSAIRMAVTGTWNVTITRLDLSTFGYSEQYPREPNKGEILETVREGRLVKAEIQTIHHDKPRVAGLGVWTIGAAEI
jgi:hypothetical protein